MGTARVTVDKGARKRGYPDLSTAAPAAVLGSAQPMQPSLSAPPGSRPGSAGDPALSRKAMRRLEERGRERSPVRSSRVRRTAPLARAATRPSPARRAARPLFTALTMLAAAAMVFVTSVPANALLGQDDLVSVRLAQYASGDAQQLDVTAAESATIVRDG